MNTKKLLREQFLATINELEPEYINLTNERITEHLLKSQMYKKAKNIFVYISHENEIDTRKIIETALSAGKFVYGPVCLPNRIMEPTRIHSLNDVIIGDKGVPEPKPGETILPKDIDLTIVPCLSCDLYGYRLGYGGGYYDKYLLDYKNDAVILCRKKLFHSLLPIEEHDICVDYYINEDGMSESVMSTSDYPFSMKTSSS